MRVLIGDLRPQRSGHGRPRHHAVADREKGEESLCLSGECDGDSPIVQSERAEHGQVESVRRGVDRLQLNFAFRTGVA